ncbi:MAG: PDDEXK nuclease domain-containing protein [Pseudomonadota bacterium]
MIKMKLNITEKHFVEIVGLIKQARYNAVKNVNKELIDLYWRVGKYVSNKISSSEWGKSVIQNLADYIKEELPMATGFSVQNIWRMKSFYEEYQGVTILSTLLRELSWSHNLLIIGKCKTSEEREFYIRITIRDKYSFRELERQINSCLYERVMLSNKSLPPVLKDLKSSDMPVFKDTYMLDFLDLPEDFQESDLRKSIVKNLRKFILEFGKDFCLVGEEYKVQVGNNDYFIDLLFYHRELKCLVVVELKTDDFKPEYIGKLNFYLEALDRDEKKEHENPSVGIILCKSKNNEVVEYALSRNISPALVAEYKLKLINKELLQKKLHELFELSES